ncbi:unnamed protein product [Brugia pahangi]|uniref:Ovule protein n=1 Tax=Brugia pahangi TaxID=6280 RepID=A0A0N4T8F6_BRUPA|nr:unnamed protein product [Brugia pahangi]
MHSKYNANGRQQIQSYHHRCILTIDPIQQLPIRISAHIFQQLSLKQRTSYLWLTDITFHSRMAHISFENGADD